MLHETATVTRAAAGYVVEQIPLAQLKPHPHNYKAHPADQLAHLVASLTAHGFYRNVVIARDNTILAGHGVVDAAQQLGWTHAPCVRVPLAPDDPRAVQVLIGDNEIARLASHDDRALTELLKALAQDTTIDALLGTGFDAQQVAALAYVTRPAHEIADKDEAAHWLGMPTYDADDSVCRLIVTCPDSARRRQALDRLGLRVADETPRTVSAAYPPQARADVGSVAVEA